MMNNSGMFDIAIIIRFDLGYSEIGKIFCDTIFYILYTTLNIFQMNCLSSKAETNESFRIDKKRNQMQTKTETSSQRKRSEVE